MRTRREATQVREIQVLRNQKPGFLLCGFPNIIVRMADKMLIVNGMYIVTEAFQSNCKAEGEILVQLDSHRMCGNSGTGRSSSADAAANAIAA